MVQHHRAVHDMSTTDIGFGLHINKPCVL